MAQEPQQDRSRAETPAEDRARRTQAREPLVRHKRGGLYFEDFVISHLSEHPLTRTVPQMDNMLFSNMTLNPQPLHIDRHFCEHDTQWGPALINSPSTLGLVIG